MRDASPQWIDWKHAAILVAGALLCFHAAYTPADPGRIGLLIVGYLVCLVQLAKLPTVRQCFYTGLLTGLLCIAPHLGFFWNIFGVAAVTLWLILALWTALFVVLSHTALALLPRAAAVLLIPFFWTGLEYFRSELYFLKFSWLSVGYALTSNGISLFIGNWGTYGIGFLVALSSSLFLVEKPRKFAVVFLVLMLGAFSIPRVGPVKPPPANLHVAGIQLEFPSPGEIQRALDKVLTADHNVDLVVLSEYTLQEPPGRQLKDWCRIHGKYLVVGGKDPLPGARFYNTAYVIDPQGEIVFKQVKSVPIQFFQDGLPAQSQKLWNSPWGKIGICICYDLSYTRVTDELIRQGARLLVVPTMDVTDWGRHEHELHARIAPVRAIEYGIPIFRLASSGISQGVTDYGFVQSSAPFPGSGEMLFFRTRLGNEGRLPADRRLAPFSVAITAGAILWFLIAALGRRRGT